VKEQLEKLVLQMYRSGILYSEAVWEFQKAFVVTVLRDLNGNQVRAAGKLDMHRNTLRRTLDQLDVDIKALWAPAPPPARDRPSVCHERETGFKSVSLSRHALTFLDPPFISRSLLSTSGNTPSAAESRQNMLPSTRETFSTLILPTFRRNLRAKCRAWEFRRVHTWIAFT
jgi:Fis family transcriptional regulator, factor for inversion stimulation protein